MIINCEISLVVENELVREGLRRILVEEGMDIRSSVKSAEDLSDSADSEASDSEHVVVCAKTGSDDAIEMIDAVRSKEPEAKIIAMVDHFDPARLSSAFCHGVDGYVMSDIGIQPLIGVLHLAAAGEKVFPSEMAELLMSPNCLLSENSYRMPEDINLSERELDILECLMEGDCNKVIARKLEITESTVKVHVKAVLRKLGVSNRTQAAVWAITHRIGATDHYPPDGEPTAALLPVSLVKTKTELRAA